MASFFFPRCQVLPRVWVGSSADSRDAEFVRSHNIGLIVNCSKTIPFSFPHVLGYRVAVDDDPKHNQAFLRYIPTAVSSIDKCLASGKSVLIHCYAGIQRSCAIAAAFIMFKLGLDEQQAMDSVKRAKPEAFDPLPTFRPALEMYYKNNISKS